MGETKPSEECRFVALVTEKIDSWHESAYNNTLCCVKFDNGVAGMSGHILVGNDDGDSTGDFKVCWRGERLSEAMLIILQVLETDDEVWVIFF